MGLLNVSGNTDIFRTNTKLYKLLKYINCVEKSIIRMERTTNILEKNQTISEVLH